MLSYQMLRNWRNKSIISKNSGKTNLNVENIVGLQIKEKDRYDRIR